VEVDQGFWVGRHQGRGLQAGKQGGDQLLGRRAHLGRIIDHQGLGMHPLQQIGGGDIGHVEGRVLTHQDDVHVLCQIQPLLGAEIRMIALLAPHRHRTGAAEQTAVFQGQGAEVIDPQLVAARLPGQGHQEGGVRLDIDRLERVHLDGDLEHGESFLVGAIARAAGARCLSWF